MTETSDRELQQWIEAWTAPTDVPGAAPELVQRYVRRRSRMLRVWLAGEAAVVIAIAPLLIRAATAGDAVERLAMALLAALALGAIAFSWWNWRGAIGAAGESTAAFLALSQLRVQRLARAVVAGWMLLAAEVLVFVPWIAYRLYGGPTPASAASAVFSWSLLAALTVLGAGFLTRLSRWTREERARLGAIQRELGDEPLPR